MQYHQTGPKRILQHDNNPKHTASHKEPFTVRNKGGLQQMVWTPQSADLNIIESVWVYMKRQNQLTVVVPDMSEVGNHSGRHFVTFFQIMHISFIIL